MKEPTDKQDKDFPQQELPPASAVEGEENVAVSALESPLETRQAESLASVDFTANRAKRFGIWMIAGTGIAVMVFCAAMLVCLLFELARHLSSNTDLLISFLTAVWEALKNGAAVSFPILLYFTRRKDR